MRVFVAGATGALGRQLVPQLVASGHEVVGMTRDEAKGGIVRGMGARPAIADALDPEAVGRAVSEADPETIVNQLTALSGPFDPRHLDRVFALTNRLRTRGRTTSSLRDGPSGCAASSPRASPAGRSLASADR